MRKKHITELGAEARERHESSIRLAVVLDDVRSMHNVGSVFRTADAFGIREIHLCGITGKPPHPEIHKTALGAEDTVPWHYHSSAIEAIKQLIAAGYTVYSVEQVHGSTPLSEWKMPEGKHQAVAVVFGNEVKGVQQEIIDLSDGCIEIPQYGTKHSLNVSVAAGIVLWQLSNQ